jgi:Ca2+/H+ antiporter
MIGNAVELIVSIIALVQGKVTIVQASLLGSMLSNLLLVLGMCFFFGGFKHKEQEFNMTVKYPWESVLIVGCSNSIVIIGIGDICLAYSVSVYCIVGNNCSHRRCNLTNKSRSCRYLARCLWNVFNLEEVI